MIFKKQASCNVKLNVGHNRYGCIIQVLSKIVGNQYESQCRSTGFRIRLNEKGQNIKSPGALAFMMYVKFSSLVVVTYQVYF